MRTSTTTLEDIKLNRDMNETEKPLWVLIKRGYNCSLSIAVKLLIEITTKLLIQ